MGHYVSGAVAFFPTLRPGYFARLKTGCPSVEWTYFWVFFWLIGQSRGARAWRDALQNFPLRAYLYRYGNAMQSIVCPHNGFQLSGNLVLITVFELREFFYTKVEAEAQNPLVQSQKCEEKVTSSISISIQNFVLIAACLRALSLWPATPPNGPELNA